MLAIKIKATIGLDDFGGEYASYNLELETVHELDRLFNRLLVNNNNFEVKTEDTYVSRCYFNSIDSLLEYRDYCVLLLDGYNVQCKLDEIVYWYS